MSLPFYYVKLKLVLKDKNKFPIQRNLLSVPNTFFMIN